MAYYPKNFVRVRAMHAACIDGHFRVANTCRESSTRYCQNWIRSQSSKMFVTVRSRSQPFSATASLAFLTTANLSRLTQIARVALMVPHTHFGFGLAVHPIGRFSSKAGAGAWTKANARRAPQLVHVEARSATIYRARGAPLQRM